MWKTSQKETEEQTHIEESDTSVRSRGTEDRRESDTCVVGPGQNRRESEREREHDTDRILTSRGTERAP